MTIQLTTQNPIEPDKTPAPCDPQEPLLLPMQIALHRGDYEMGVQLSDDHWRVVEASVGIEAAHSCWACRSQDTQVLGHQPMWRYDPTSQLRTLVGFELLCTECVLARDPVLAMALLNPADVDASAEYFRQINGIDRLRYGQELTRAFTEWYRLRRIDWRTSLGAFAACVSLPSHRLCVKCEFADQLDLFAEEVQS